jgi:16S rRNA (cytidine1402-2'-O)-methyltransferase
LQTCKAETKLCIAVDVTSPAELIKTKTIVDWRKDAPGLHKHLCIFLLYAS